MLAGNPVSIRCPHCQAVLRAGPSTRRITYMALAAVLAMASFGVFAEHVLDWPARSGLFTVLGGSVVIGAVAGLFVWKIGDFAHETRKTG